MTQTENENGSGSLHGSHEPSDGPRRPGIVAALLLGVAALVAVDLIADALEGGSVAHLVFELVAMSAALAGAWLLLRDLAAARARTHALARELAATHRDAERYRAEAAELVRGLGEAIDRQFDRWQLTESEKEVAVLLLKGLSHKEVAEVRGTSERTARGQAREVYRKAGLGSRAALSAFFLEDLLPPAHR